MPEFVCKLGTVDGQIVERTMTATSESDVRRDLSQQEFLVLSVHRRWSLSLPFIGRRRRISASEFLVFNQELMALIRAGMAILPSLEMLIERRKNPVFRQALVEIRDDVTAGASLSEAFEARGRLFPPLFATSLASGERSGEIATVLKRYIDYARNIAGIRKKILSAAAYPAILVTAMAIMIYVMVAMVFPKFADFFSTMKADLPLPTVVLLGFSAWVEQNNLWVIGAAVGGVVAFLLWNRTESGRRFTHEARFKIPIVGSVFKNYAVTRFTRTLSTLISGGIPMVVSLQTASRTVGNTLFSERLDRVAQQVREGGAVWDSLEQTGLLSDMAVGMIKVGESTGAMTEMLDNVSEFYEAEIEQRIQTLLSMLEPILLLVMAVVVGGVILAVYMPLLSAFSSAKM
ncbi:MAG: type II secretion system F family protein [Acidobacteriota bacterium]